MTRMFRIVLATTAMFWAVPALAQSSAPSSPSVNLFYIGANTGPAAVEKIGAVFGLEGGVRVWKSLDAVGELQWVGNAVTGRQSERIGTLATQLGKTQGVPATGSLTVPAFYGGIGGRFVFEQAGKYRPYGIVTVGGSRVNLKPAITLSGKDVTSVINTYGVTLGQDVIGKYNYASVSGGIGMIMSYGSWYFDGGARVLNIGETGQSARVVRLVIGGGRRY